MTNHPNRSKTNKTLRLMAAGHIANRSREGMREVWRIDDGDGNKISCGRTVSQLIDAGFAWGHFPTNGRSAGISDAGKVEAKRLGYQLKDDAR